MFGEVLRCSPEPSPRRASNHSSQESLCSIILNLIMVA
jgi:hypothetical protein